MNLTEKPDTKNWPETHYVFIEKIGPFMETAQEAWQALHQGVEAIAQQTQITGFLSLYKIHPQMVYRAGVAVQEKPAICL